MTHPDTAADEAISMQKFRLNEAMGDGDRDYAIVPTNVAAAGFIESVDSIAPTWDEDFMSAVERSFNTMTAADVLDAAQGLEYGREETPEEAEVALQALLKILRARSGTLAIS